MKNIDVDKVHVALRGLRKDALLRVLDRAIDALLKSRLEAVMGRDVSLESCQVTTKAEGGLLAEVRTFSMQCHRGVYYESFSVNYRNSTEKSRGTLRWIAECERLFARCVKEARCTSPAEVAEPLFLLFDLLRCVDEGKRDMVFWADEGGSYEVYVDWEALLPICFTAMAQTMEPQEYAHQVTRVIKDFVHYNAPRFLEVARQMASPEQMAALPPEIKGR